MPRTPTACALAALATLVVSSSAVGSVPAAVPAETTGEVATLPPASPHWFWVADFVLRRTALLDADDGRFLGMLSAGVGAIAPVFSPARGEIYLPETYYSRGSRGTRTDVVTVYDARTLAPTAEVVIPPKRADVVHAVALATLLDDGRFLAIYDFTPATSVSIVDVAARRLVGEIETPGCGLVYAAGPRRLAMLCGDGSLLLVSLDEDGHERARMRSEPFFDPIRDPVTEKAVRIGDAWLFVSFDGIVHPVDLSGPEPRFGETWSLLRDEDREGSWRLGGTQLMAVHEASRRLYGLVHRGGRDSHKEAGREVWVWNLDSHARERRIALRNEAAAFLAQQLGVAGGAGGWILEHLLPSPGIDSIAVTQDDDPRLLAVTRHGGSVGVYDARSGAFLRHVGEVGIAPGALQAPWR